MQKPELIIALEKELDITFTEVSIEEIRYWKNEKSAEYAINNIGKIIGLRIQQFALKQLPNSIKALQDVKTLDLGFNQLTDISVLSNLPNIMNLDLSGNQLTDISVLSCLSNVINLDLGWNQLTDISALSNLKQLKSLNLGITLSLKLSEFFRISQSMGIDNVSSFKHQNQINDISALKGLTRLVTLNLSSCAINNISVLSHLTRLKTLVLWSNNISDISALSDLNQLEYLNLASNQLTDISALKNLTQLIILKLRDNQFRDILALKNLKQLEIFTLQNNPIEIFPEWICDFSYMDIQWDSTSMGEKGYITLYNNPLQEPPIEIVKQGKEAIRNYFEKKKEEGTDYLYEAKLILVGEERAGKTTIAKALTKDRDFEINLNEKSTHGIDIIKWMIPKANINTPKDFRFNIWDFGGQDIYHATHQFFLTKRSLYLFLTEARKDLRFDDFYYWLNIINSLGGDSPILAVKNKIDQSSASNDISTYKKLFPQLINDNLMGISCNTAHENWTSEYLPLLNIFKKKMYEVVKNKQIESMGTPLPKTWVKVREAITKLQDQGKNYITLADYKAICKQYHFDQKTINSLSQLFHDLGVFLHFQDNRARADSHSAKHAL